MTGVTSLQREEVRGLFVLGVIATVFEAERILPEIYFGLGITSTLLLNFLMLFWGCYVFFMAIAVSQDWVGTYIANACYTVARFLFRFGILFVCLIGLTLAISYTPLGSRIGTVVGLVAAFVSGLLMAFFEPSTKQAPQESRKP